MCGACGAATMGARFCPECDCLLSPKAANTAKGSFVAHPQQDSGSPVDVRDAETTRHVACPVHPLDLAFPMGSGEDSLSKQSSTAMMEDPPAFDQGAVRAAFLKFWIKLLGKYRSHLVKTLTQGEDAIDSKAFVDDGAREEKVFKRALMDTQMFACFVHEAHPESSQRPHPSIRFFDDCIEHRKQSRMKDFRQTVVAPKLANHYSAIPPCTSPPLDHAPANGDRFVLRSQYFGHLRYVQPLEQAERKRTRPTRKATLKKRNMNLMLKDKTMEQLLLQAKTSPSVLVRAEALAKAITTAELVPQVQIVPPRSAAEKKTRRGSIRFTPSVFLDPGTSTTLATHAEEDSPLQTPSHTPHHSPTTSSPQVPAKPQLLSQLASSQDPPPIPPRPA